MAVTLLMNILMKANEVDDPDIEGFIACELEIRPYSGALDDREHSFSSIFEPHYVQGTPMLKYLLTHLENNPLSAISDS
jgi:hypothetical protein